MPSRRSVPDAPVGGAFGPNAWLVDDMYEQYRADPSSVPQSWQDFFADYVPSRQAVPVRVASGDGEVSKDGGGSVAQGEALPSASSAVAPRPASGVEAPSSLPLTGPLAPTAAGPAETHRGGPAAKEAGDAPGEPLRGAAARVASNMEASLSVPTATSVRTVPARLLEVNRQVVNRHLARETGAKISFTHLIGYAVVQALQAVPALNASFVPDSDGKGTPGIVRHRHVGLGLAVDVGRPDGSRTLLVPVVRQADTLDFHSFVMAYEEMVRKVHTGKVSPDDFAGATATLTNPGTLGTVQSVPRLMPGQGAIIGVGALGYPAEYQAADRRNLAALGVGPVVTLTSTYDHRIIQGAESGLFLTHVAECLTGGHGFYEGVFAAMDVPYEPVRWQSDVNVIEGEHLRLVKQVHVQSLINMYRVRGHLIADLDPLAAERRPLHPELDPTTYGLTLWDLDREFVVDGLAGRNVMTLGNALDVLRDAYCRTLGVEYMHIQDPEQKRWIQEHVEGIPLTLAPDEQRHVLNRLNAAEAFERFLHSRYVGQKRFSLEGAESTIVLLDTILSQAAGAGLSEAVLGTAHRGRLNVLANIVGKSYREIFREFEGDLDPDSVQGSGDVKYHKGATGKFAGRSGGELSLTLASNPSHLEAVDPVVEGMTRAKQDHLPDDQRLSVLSVLVHGDAAFAGQGVVAETLELSQLTGYRIGGTVHVVINNQLGFTTAPESARSSVYPTDVAKMVQSPVIHVNGDDPEACVRAARLAFGFRQAFHKDVVIDLVCYRRYGHNEGDDPSYTQPKMYALIDAHRSVRKLYTESLVRRGDITLEEAERALEDFQSRLQLALDETRQSSPPQPTSLPPAATPDLSPPAPPTGVARDELERLAEAAVAVPHGFTMHPKLLRQFGQRAQMVAQGEVDWSLGEAMAFGSLLLEGTDVRLSGQDTRRGTFSQRHAVLVDFTTGAEWVPLAHLGDGAGRFGVYDSLLSEYAALGFEYGYSVEAPDALVAWEAQFGDFDNGAQIVIDNFLVAAEDKWGQRSGLVLLLPHGYEGQGPEHSSARIERFLTLAARRNMRLAQPTTAAQYFHLLRSQLRIPVRHPLVVFTPKSLLRARQSRSPIEQFNAGSFVEVLDDPAVTEGEGRIDAGRVQRVVLCSGKVAFDVMGRRDHLRAGTAGLPASSVDPATLAVVRTEQLYPWPEARLAAVLDGYRNATEVVWVQEEPENMGPWNFVHGRLHRLLRDRFTLSHVSRAESASPATGSAALHHLEQEDLLQSAFA
ncbi:MAG TPA: multifunctional oxoglutarate decarboxylase/oxoglutarate dehydrogenase thiamine pyrophosphate-binding subunit/dihydrolipoyllysine-residue succinyltransferase subunit [Acidimicrobiales bacterium]|nr:multifunctional oxoglutarate decarboxylase/oxoglutarate dehydrogenase thiamine pyrophosphate-binding subunit/dihydrolipoyllysine-residue succinyltransferase subunit [Acidimicrobiales bacterium]